jgi:GntR family transcriptional repressor for pyruvate dehydrogenase complex
MSPETRRSPNVRRIAPAYEQVAGQLRQLIVQGELGAGERLPAEQELTQMFGVSRSTVREALRALSSEHLITTVRGVKGGSFVAHPDIRHMADYLQASLGLLTGGDQMSVADLLEARELLEVPAARLAAERRTDAQLAEMQALAGGDHAHLVAFPESRDFHVCIIEAAGNALLEVIARPIFTVLAARFYRPDAELSDWEFITHDHAELLAAIEDRDGARAAEAMRTHLDRAKGQYDLIDRVSRPDA